LLVRRVLPVAVADGRLIGDIRGYLKVRDIWNGHYKGEIVQENRLLCRVPTPSDDRGPTTEIDLPGVPAIPDPIDPIDLPPGYQDIDLS
jgi:hypothetical protein